MKLEKFKRNNKLSKILVMISLIIVLMLTGLYLYGTFAVFSEEKHFNVINGNVMDPGDIYFVVYENGVLTNTFPKKINNYVFEHGECTNNVSLSWNNASWTADIDLENYQKSKEDYSKTRCTIYFEKQFRVQYETGNLLPTYDSSSWYTPNNDNVKISQSSYGSTTFNIATKPEYASGAFGFILKKDSSNLEWITHFSATLDTKRIFYEFTNNTGNYVLETRLNGGKADLKEYNDYYFTNGKIYIFEIGSVITSSSEWQINNATLSEYIPDSLVLNGDKISKPDTNIYKPGYTVGNKWYTDYERTKEYDFNTPVTSDLILYAGMEKN